ncbi:glycosyltransferase family 4 protein [Georgenia muralis]
MNRAGLALVTWDREAPSGGNTYNDELVRALRLLGVEVGVHRLPGAWPVADALDRAALTEVLLGQPLSLVDGIVACGAPDAVATAVGAGRRVGVLVHMPLAEERGLTGDERAERSALEARSLGLASVVVATSRTAADDLRWRHGLRSVAVARPGAVVPGGDSVEPGGRAILPGGDSVIPGGRAVLPRAEAGGRTTGTGAVADEPPGRAPHLLMLGALTPTKDPLGLVRALGLLRDLDWTATIAGPGDAEPGYAAQVARSVAAEGLTGRVRLPGPLTGPALDEEWRATDLLVLPSRTETFGLVVVEALARGIPAVVGAGTGAEEALGLGRGAGEAGRSAGGRGDDGLPSGRGLPANGGLRGSGGVPANGGLRGSGGVPANGGLRGSGGLPGAAVQPGDPVRLAEVLRSWLVDPGLRARWRRAALEAAPNLPTWEDTARAAAAALGLVVPGS